MILATKMRISASVRLFLALLLSCTATAHAHPGWAVVQDGQGTLFFTDTKQVWAISVEDRISLAVAAVHTHELHVDAQGNLFGEHLWYEGDATGRWRHRVWRRRPDGTVTDIIPAREGFRTDHSFVQDAQGNMYWADRTTNALRKRHPDGTITTHSAGPFRSVERMTALADGTLYLMDAGALRRVSPQGAVSTVVKQLTGEKAAPSGVGRLNYHMGLWTDAAGRVYIAAAAERSVLRVDAAGTVAIVDRSTAPWAPAGGMVDRQQRLWVLEYDDRNRIRMRRLDRDGRTHVLSPTSPSG